MLHIFNHTIKPIALYGSEVWGTFSSLKFQNNAEKYIKKEIDSNILEKLHTQFCKFILGVRTRSSNNACRGELGSMPILFSILINLIKYWCHIVKLENAPTTLLNEAFKLSEEMSNNNKESWVGSIKEIFKFLKLDYIFNNHSHFKANYIIKRTD